MSFIITASKQAPANANNLVNVVDLSEMDEDDYVKTSDVEERVAETDDAGQILAAYEDAVQGGQQIEAGDEDLECNNWNFTA